MTLTGVILAGGDAERFGSDKLAYPLEGRPILARVVEAMVQATDRVVVSVADRPAARRLAPTVGREVAWLEDLPELGGAGPGAGMLTALDQLETDELLFAAGDMPWLSAQGLRALMRRARAGRATSAAPIWPSGWTEPLVQWQQAPPWKARVARLPSRDGQGARPTDLLRGGADVLLFPVRLLSPDARCFANINRPADLETAPRPLREAGGPIPRGAEAGRLFWEALDSCRRGLRANASASFAEEARLLGASGLPHLEMHALEDALRYGPQGDAATLGREGRLAALRQSLRPG